MVPHAGAAYTYNTQGLRISKTVSGKKTSFTLVGGNVWSDGTYNYVWGAELITNGSVYYIYNAHGDVVQLLNASGAVTKTYDYDAYGNELERDLSDTNPFRYCGEYYDTETGFIYLRARYYDPTVGRFISKDTHWNVGNMIYGDNPDEDNPRPDIEAIIQSGNIYVYCMSNPLKYVDKNGEFGLLASLGIGAGIGAIIGGGAQIISNLVNGEKWSDGLGSAIVSGAVGGAISAIKVKSLGMSMLIGALGNVAGTTISIAGEFLTGKRTSFSADDIMAIISSFVIGAGAGAIGYYAAQLIESNFLNGFKSLTRNQQAMRYHLSNQKLKYIRRAIRAGDFEADCIKKLIDDFSNSIFANSSSSSIAASAGNEFYKRVKDYVLEKIKGVC